VWNIGDFEYTLIISKLATDRVSQVLPNVMKGAIGPWSVSADQTIKAMTIMKPKAVVHLLQYWHLA
jgi:hypothetical protein